MLRFKLALLVGVAVAFPLFSFVGPPRDQTELPHVLPAEGAAAAGVRDVPGFIEKYDKFSAAIGKPGGGRRLRGILALVSGPAGIDVTEGRLFVSGYRDGDDEGFFLGVPCPDPDAVAVALGLGKGGLKPNKVTPHKHQEQNRFALLRGGHVYISDNERPLAKLARDKRLRDVITPAHRTAMSEADIMLHVNLRARGMAPELKLEDAEGVMKPEGEAEKKVARQMVVAANSVQYLLWGVNLGDGVGMRFNTVFPKKIPAEATELLSSLQGGPGASGLDGLPTGKVILAHAASTDGAKNAIAAKLLLRAAFRGGITDSLVAHADQPLVTGVFSTLWRKVKGRRLAVYQNADDLKQGLFSVVGILDTDDPKRLMGEIGELAKFAKGKDLDLSDPSGKGDDVASVKKLIADLDSDEHEVREAASTKLALIGEPALPFVEEAAKSKDAEVRRRASRLLVEMKAVRDARRKEVLAAEGPKHIRPGFVLERGAEKIDGHAIDIVHVRLEKKDAAAVAVMRKMAGPDWAKVRMATVGKKVVVLVGSDVGLFKQALKNVKGGAKGLQGDASLAAFRKHADAGRKFELHVALEALEALTAEGIDEKKLKVGGLSSVAVAVDAGRFEVAAWLPPEGFKALARRMGWWLWV